MALVRPPRLLTENVAQVRRQELYARLERSPTDRCGAVVLAASLTRLLELVTAIEAAAHWQSPPTGVGINCRHIWTRQGTRKADAGRQNFP
jgi:hypothetical protein